MEKKNCKWCGKEFETEIDNLFCSQSCYLKWRKEVYDKKDTRICPVCHSEFIPTTYNNIYCSKECYKKSIVKKTKAFRKKHPEKHREENRRYYLNNREKVKNYVNEWRRKNPEKVKKIYSNYQKRHREELNEYQNIYRKRKKLDICCKEHDGPDNCPYSDCIC